MPVQTVKALLEHAQQNAYAIGAFNAIGIEHAEAIVTAAERERAPVIIQVSQNAILYHFGAVEAIGSACLAIASRATVPVGLHLDHSTTWELCEAAINTGFSSVMFDASHMSIEQNADETAKVARKVHARKGSIEGELGVVGGKDGQSSTEGGKTDPSLAHWYVSKTDIDSLAIAVGTSHYMVEKTATIDFELIERINKTVSIPLVLHGASGVADDDIREAARLGITKINFATELNRSFTDSIRESLLSEPRLVDPRTYLASARDAISTVVSRRLHLLGSTGRF